jgi:hypothetical protein
VRERVEGEKRIGVRWMSGRWEGKNEEECVGTEGAGGGSSRSRTLLSQSLSQQ